MPSSLRIMIAEDQTMVRQALVSLLELEDDITVVAQAASGGEAVAMAHRYQPDVPSWTSRCRGGDGRRSPRRLGRKGSPGRSSSSSRRSGGPATWPLDGGQGSGFCSKTPRPPESYQGHQAGGAARSGSSTRPGRQRRWPRGEPADRAGDRGPVRRAGARGHLGPGGRAAPVPGTIRNHLSAAIQKLGARNRAEAVQVAERKGWF
jgi:two-component system response regulator DesR